MESSITGTDKSDVFQKKKHKNKFSLRSLRKSLRFRPEMLKLILKMRQCIRKKNILLKQVKHKLIMIEKSLNSDKTATQIDDPDEMKTNENNKISADIGTKFTEQTENRKVDVKDTSTQTEELSTSTQNLKTDKKTDTEETITEEGDAKKKIAWDINNDDVKSIAEQVKEAAQSALQQSGMVYVESAGMYYDYKTGYYYNSELGLYYHTDTQCYYYYSEDKKEFVFHSYPDRSAVAACASFNAHEKRKAKKNKKAWKTEEDIDNLTKNLSQDKEDEASKSKRKKKTEKKSKENVTSDNQNANQNSVKEKTDTELKKDNSSKETEDGEEKKDENKEEDGSDKEDLEDGECSETGSEAEKSDGEESDASTSTASDDDTIAKHHPPCMRVIVRDTNVAKLKVGSLFLVTKDGGTIGREGEQHAILIRDHNVSRSHLDIQYDMTKRMYVATDLGSKNGTLLNGIQMSESQVVSKPMQVMHGSTIQLGETKLLCHIHAGNDTCGHCEPGLLMETQEKEKAAYTRTCNVQRQHQLELARLKNKYAPEPLMIEEGSYNDRAKARRETVGSSHSSVKTQSTDVDTFIAPENKGFKLLEKMGWSKGEGLGKDCQGDVEPIPMVTNEGKAGLGTPGSTSAPPLVPTFKVRNTLGPATLRLATKSKLLQPPAKAFLSIMDEDSE